MYINILFFLTWDLNAKHDYRTTSSSSSRNPISSIAKEKLYWVIRVQIKLTPARDLSGNRRNISYGKRHITFWKIDYEVKNIRIPQDAGIRILKRMGITIPDAAFISSGRNNPVCGPEMLQTPTGKPHFPLFLFRPWTPVIFIDIWLSERLCAASLLSAALRMAPVNNVSYRLLFPPAAFGLHKAE